MSKKNKCVTVYPKELNPCPNCGGRVHYEFAPFPNQDCSIIKCDCGLETYLERTERVLELKWNSKEQQSEMIIN